VLDLIQNYTVNTYSKEVPLVISEQGGYILNAKKAGYDGADAAIPIAERLFPGTGFEWEMKTRSIVEFVHVSSIIANTMTFMDHPHTVEKSVPFILLNTSSWDPRYYANLYVHHNYTDKSQWVPTRMMDFYKFFRDVRGTRVKVLCDDPDIQVQAFRDGRTVQVVMNNLSNSLATVALQLPKAKKTALRRFGRNKDFTPYLTEQPLKALKNITLAGREALVVRAEYNKPIAPRRSVNEVPCYGDKVALSVKGEVAYQVNVPDVDRLDYATLRVGLDRPAGTDKELRIKVNGNELNVPLEDCNARLEEEVHGYASLKLVHLDPRHVKAHNKIELSFPDGKPGAIGSVVIRAGIAKI
jgi:hypothetical protein